MIARIPLIPVLGLLLVAVPSIAQDMPQAPARSHSGGLLLGLNALGNSIQETGGGEFDSGAGISLIAGYGFTPMVGAFFRFDAANVEISGVNDSYLMGYADVGLRFSFGAPARPLVPYVDAALTGWSVSYESVFGTLESRGSGFSLGGGLHYHFNPRLALNAGVLWTAGKFTEFRMGGEREAIDEGGRGARVNLGLSFFPMAP
jgi:hypothetical protein